MFNKFVAPEGYKLPRLAARLGRSAIAAGTVQTAIERSTA